MNKATQSTITIPIYPLEFEQIINAKNQNFVGRKFVFSAINNFLNQSDRGYFTIIGEPGIGKSTILAHYVSQNPGVVYYNVEIVGKSRVEEFFTKIYTQLIEISQNQGGKNPTPNFPDPTTKDSGFLSLLLQQISDRLHPEQRLIIAIDACDRIDINHQSPGSNIFYLPRYLPEKVYFILTRRPFLSDRSGLLIETPAQSLDLSAYSEQNRADIQEYISNYLTSQNINSHQLLTQIGNDEINFMYVSQILSAIDRNISPENLQLYYQDHWEKMNLLTSQQQAIALQILNILVQEQSSTIDTIAERLDKDEYDIKVILDKWREFLHLDSISEKIHYSFYHPSFRDWLREKISTSKSS